MNRLRNILLTGAMLFTASAFAAECSSGEDCFQKADRAVLDGDFAVAVDFAEQGCDLDNTDTCVAAGSLYRLGRGIAQDHQKANSYFEKACELGNGDGCSQLAAAYFSGLGVAQDMEKAYQMSSQGCAAENAAACMQLGVMQISGKGVAQDIDAGQANLDLACSLEDVFCAQVEQIRSMFKQLGVLQ